MLTVLPIVLVSSFFVLPVAPQGFKCQNTNYRLFTVHTSLSEVWHGSSDSAAKMCKRTGHLLAHNTGCINQLFQNPTEVSALFGTTAPKYVWIDQGTNRSNDTSKCLSWSPEINNTAMIACTEKAVVMCLGFSTDDNILKEEHPNPDLPKTIIYVSGVKGSQPPAIDAYYVLCGTLGVILIAIVVSAAIWRSGYINNRYSFRRLPAAVPQKPAPKSRTITSQLDSEIPHGYVKASITKETIA